MALVNSTHLRELGYCAAGVRAFCEKHKLDFRTFMRPGLEADTLRATGDALAIRAANYAEGKDNGK